MKHKIFKSFALLCAMILGTGIGWAKQYCGEELTSTIGWTGKYELSAEKLTSTQSKFTISVDEEEITGFYQLIIQNTGGGAAQKTLWDPGDADFSNPALFSVAADKKSATITIPWTTYPTSDIQIHLVMRRDNSAAHGAGSDIFGNDLSDIDVTAACPLPTITSEYCSTTFRSGETQEVLFTWVTLDNGDIQVTITEPDGSVKKNTHFRGKGVNLSNLKVGGTSGVAASTYFNTTVSASSNVQTFTLIDPANKPAYGTEIYYPSATVEYAVDNNTNAWPSIKFSYTYGGVCASSFPVEAVNLDQTEASIEEGKTLKLTPVFTPGYASNKNVTWASDNTAVATVSNGTVTAVAVGDANIIVTTEDGGFKDTCAVTVFGKLSQCYGDLGHFATPANAKIHYEIVYEDGTATVNVTSLTGFDLDFCEIHIVGVGNYAMTADGNGGYTWSKSGATVGDKWYFRLMWSDTQMGGNEMSSEGVSSTDPNIRYYIVGDCPPPYKKANEDYTKLAGASASSETSQSATTHLPADGIDNDLDTYWEAKWDVNNQYYVVDLGKECIFNSVSVRFGGHRAGKFDVQYSRDGENYVTFATDVVGINNDDASCGGASSRGRYIRLLLKDRPNGYGFDVKNVQVKYVENSVLTALTATIADLYVVAGQQYTLSIDARDQYNLPMDPGTITYTVTPESMGVVLNNVFVADAEARGEVTISAKVGEVVSPNIKKCIIVDDTNLALNKAMKNGEEWVGTYYGTYTPDKAVDGTGELWQGSVNNGDDPTTGRTYDAWFVVDLGDTYDVDLMTIQFEGAACDAYHIDFSNNAVNWATGYSFSGTTGMVGRTDVVYGFKDNIAVRYIRFFSTKASTGYGMKVIELKAFGVQNASSPLKTVYGNITPAGAGSVTVTVNDEPVSKVEAGTEVVYTALPTHANFVKWSDEVTDNPRTVMVTQDTTLTAVFVRTEYVMSAAINKAACGTVAVSSDLVVPGDSVTFTATPASEFYEFVSWTNANKQVVSADAEFTIYDVDADYALTANFEDVRVVYCHKPITSNSGKKMFLTMGQTTTDGVYQIKFEGSSEATLTGIANPNYIINWVRTDIEYKGPNPTDAQAKLEGQDIIFNLASGRWQFSNEGYGSAWITFKVATGHTWEDIYVHTGYIAFTSTAGEMVYTLPNMGELRYHIDWPATCVDEEAPVMDAPVAEALDPTTIRLTLRATDNLEGTITYTISRTGAEDIVIKGESGETVVQDVTGLTTGTQYTFSVVAKDGAGNACQAQECQAAPAADQTAPYNVTITAMPLSDKMMRLTMYADDNLPGELLYNIAWAGGGLAQTTAERGTQVVYDVTGLTPSTEYVFTLTVKDAADNWSGAVNSTAVSTFDKNLALNQPATAGGTALAIAAGNNANLGDRWASGGGDMAKNWWAVDLGKVYDVKNIRISYEDACPTAYTLQSSNDGTNWAVIQAYNAEPKHGAQGANFWNEYPVEAQARYLKIVATATTFGNAYGMSFWEFEAYGTPAVDSLKPVMSTFTATGVSSSSVQLKAQATDNFCDSLVYVFSCEGVEKGSVKKAYGEDASFTVSGLTMGTQYNFSVVAKDAAQNVSEEAQAQAEPITDTEAPQNVSATAGTITAVSIELLLNATDNLGGDITYTISRTGAEDVVATGASGVQKSVVIDGLNYDTEYSFSVVAKDGSDNAAAAVVCDAKTEKAKYPVTAAPVPTRSAANVISIYSDVYTNKAWGHNENWGQATQLQEKEIAGDHHLYYTNLNWLGWQCGQGAEDVSKMLGLHIDIWADADGQLGIVPIYGGTGLVTDDNRRKIVSLVGKQWNSFDLNLATDFPGLNLSSIFQFKFDNAQGTIFAIDNLYFFIDPALTRPNLVEGALGTICVPYEVAPADRKGAGFYRLSHTNGGFVYFIEETDTLEAGRAYVFQAEAEKVEIFKVNGAEEVVDPVNDDDSRGLIGSFEAMAAGSLTGKYGIANDYKIHILGAGAYMEANRAYIDMSLVPNTPLVINDPADAPVRRQLSFGGAKNTPTNLDEQSAISNQQSKMIIDGQLIIIRDGKMYNAQGIELK